MLTSSVTDELLRAQIVELLATERLCVCHLVELTGATSSHLSNHLRVLRACGAVERSRAAAVVKRPCG